MIGQDNAEALVPLEIRRGSRNEPFAIRTMFGRCLNESTGNTFKIPGNRVLSHFISTTNINSIEEQVSKLWKVEDDVSYGQDIAMSQENKQVLNMWENEIKLVDGHYELPIPWRDPCAPIPNNVSVATHRLQSLRKSLAKKGLIERYDSEIQKLLRSNYAEVVLQNEIYQAKRVWYLPHHGVVTSKKPDKLRVVFNCSAKFKGESLNEKCLQGPDLNNNLVSVLLNFRVHPY